MWHWIAHGFSYGLVIWLLIATHLWRARALHWRTNWTEQGAKLARADTHQARLEEENAALRAQVTAWQDYSRRVEGRNR